jgi:hypothetical protein
MVKREQAEMRGYDDAERILTDRLIVVSQGKDEETTSIL